ncbi:cytochrome P450 [Podospora aff. communis PSN243]|uniref:Cytochrome P450 n=1 Tax=Podospora aff. communis PSN243 TaxID=3040156 RepID=A0AAV9GD68_9PEZI|nr:cytochrome P450 [Podospora aff. communis PSN243]
MLGSLSARIRLPSFSMLFFDDVNLTSAQLLPLGAGAVVVYYFISSFATWYRLRHIPGPFLASFSYLWLMRNNFLGISSKQLVDIKKYGRVVRIAPNYVLTDDPVALRRISGARSTYGRDGWWTALRIDPRQDNMLTTMDTAAHDRLKAKTANGYNGRDNVDIEGGINHQLQKLKDVIRKHYLSTPEQTRKADLVWIIRFFTLDSVTELAYGEPFGYLEANKDLFDFNKQVDEMTKPMAVMIDTPVLRTIVNSPLAPHIMPKVTDKDGMGRLVALGQEFVAKHFATGATDSKDMVGSFMRHGLSQSRCAAECVVQVIAGSDTTGTTIRTALLHLISTPRIYNAFRAEAASAIASGLVSPTDPITHNQGRKLPYLTAVIYESLRFRPPALYGHFKSVPAGGDTIDGVYLPEGTAVGHNLFGLMMSPELFGNDVEIFRPERFLECSDAEKRAEMERTVELAFGSGRWMCAGKLVAFTQLYKCVFELVREFEMQVVDVGRPWVEESAIFWSQGGMAVRITERGV